MVVNLAPLFQNQRRQIWTWLLSFVHKVAECTATNIWQGSSVSFLPLSARTSKTRSCLGEMSLWNASKGYTEMSAEVLSLFLSRPVHLGAERLSWGNSRGQEQVQSVVPAQPLDIALSCWPVVPAPLGRTTAWELEWRQGRTLKRY